MKILEAWALATINCDKWAAKSANYFDNNIDLENNFIVSGMDNELEKIAYRIAWFAAYVKHGPQVMHRMIKSK